jgi:hypothetical protein
VPNPDSSKSQVSSKIQSISYEKVKIEEVL